MSQSALLGDPPITPNDKIIYNGILKSKDSLHFPNPKYPFDQPKPYPDAPNTWEGQRMLAATSCLLAGIIIVNGGRFCIRFHKRVPLGFDDVFALFAALIAMGYCSTFLWMWTNHSSTCYGRHSYYCTYEAMNNSYTGSFAVQVVFYPGVYFAKLSILYLNRRITAFTRGWFDKVFWIMLALLIIFDLFSFLGTLITCIPVASHFSLIAIGETDPKSLHCLSKGNTANIQTAARALHISSDLLLLSIPLLVVWKVQMAWRMKAMVGFLFGFGIVTVVASIMRIVIVSEDSLLDVTVDIFGVQLWDTIDISFSSMVTSLPIWAGTIDHFFKRASLFVYRVSDSLGKVSYYSSTDRSRSRGERKPVSARAREIFLGATPGGTSQERLHDAERNAPTPLALESSGKTRSTAQGGGTPNGGKVPPPGHAIARWDEIELSQISTKEGHEMV